MKMLLIGNGFDLAHDLETGYDDFLDFKVGFDAAWEAYYLNNSKFIVERKSFQDYYQRLFEYRDKEDIRNEFRNLTLNNIWINYFEKKRKSKEYTWTGFENEIRKVVSAMEKIMRGDKKDKELNSNLVNSFDPEFILEPNDDRRAIRIEKYLVQMKNVVRALEIYLGGYVSERNISVRLSEIKQLQLNEHDLIISFNYIDTYNRVYRKYNKVDVDFVHGKAEFNLHENNMVLGFHDDDKSNDYIHMLFAEFRKYFQRIEYGTESKHRKYLDVDENDEKNLKDVEVYVFGHSLDVADKDILEDIFMARNVKRITVYYHNDNSKREKINNLEKIMGHAVFMKKAYGNNAMIKFIEQKKV